MPNVPAFVDGDVVLRQRHAAVGRLPGAGHLEVAVDRLVAQRFDDGLGLRIFDQREVGGELLGRAGELHRLAVGRRR